jgi:hypothetical protein
MVLCPAWTGLTMMLIQQVLMGGKVSVIEELQVNMSDIELILTSCFNSLISSVVLVPLSDCRTAFAQFIQGSLW